MSTIAEQLAEYQNGFQKTKKVKPKVKKTKKKKPQQGKKTFKPLFIKEESLPDVINDMIIDGVRVVQTKGLEKKTYTYKTAGTDASHQKLQETLSYWDEVMIWLLDYGEQQPDFQIAFDKFLDSLPK